MNRNSKNVRRARKTFLAMSLSAAMMGSVLGGVVASPVEALAASTVIQEDFEGGNYGGYVRGDATADLIEGGRTGKALKLSNRAQNWHTYSYDVKDYAGKKVEVEAYMKTGGKNAVVECHSNDGEDHYDWLLNQEVSSADEWTKISGTVTLSKGAQELYFSTGSGTEDYLLDDVKISVDDSAGNGGVAEEKTFAVSDLEVFKCYDAEIEGNTIKITKQYGEVRFAVPEEIANRVEGVTVNGDGNYGKMAVKMLYADTKGTDETELFEVAYGSNKVSKMNTELTPIKYVSVMSLDEKGSTFKVDSITLKLNDGKKKELSIQKDIPDLYKEMEKGLGKGVRVGTCIPASALNDSVRMELATKHFNSFTCENEMKPDSFLGATPNKDNSELGIKLDFSEADKMADAILAYNEANRTDYKMRGHVLVWHAQTKAWFFHEDFDTSKPLLSKEAMLKRMDSYIKAVMEHYYGADSKYKDLIFAWDVVNEAVSDATNTVRTQGDAAGVETSWYSIFSGDDTFIREAFKSANKYAPANVKLFYNDYNDTTPAKVKGICSLLKAIKSTEGARIDGMGMQGHYAIDAPSIAELENAIRAYSAVVGEVQITELDFKATNGYTGSAEEQKTEYTKQGYRYKAIYEKLCELNKEEGLNITDVVFWGTDDGHSWLNDANTVGGSGDGSAVCPLPFDREYQAKPAYWGIVDSSKLEPFTNEVDVLESVPGKIAFDAANATIIPSWSKNGLSVKVQVLGEADSVTLYVDPTNDRNSEDNKAIKAITKKSSEGKKIEGGFEVEFAVDGSFSILQKVAFDVVVKNGSEVVSYNDLTNNQANSSKYYAQMTLKPFMTIGKGKATIDGKMDGIWDKVPAVPLEVKAGSLEASATAKLMWDEDNLYVLMDVKDPNLDKTSSAAHEQDSVEIFIDEDNMKTDSLDENDKQYRINYDNEQSFNGASCTADNIVSKTTVTKDGYIVEAAIKWTSMNGAPNKLIGLDLQINDGKDGGRIGTANWYDASGAGWSKSAVFGTAKLSDTVYQEVSGGSIPGGSSGSGSSGVRPETKPDSGNGTKPDSGNETKPDSGNETKPDSGNETKPDTPQQPDTPEPPKKGDVVADDKTYVKVEVSDVKKKEVKYKEPANKKAKTVSIPATVKINGVTYKVTKIADNAFKNNKTITKVTVGSNIKTIGKNAFSGATKLKTVSIGKNVTDIGANAFKGCSSLTSVTLPSKATKIGANAFNGCKKLKTIKITSTKLSSKTVSKNAFKGLTKTTTIKVPKKKLSAYKKLFKQKGLSSKVKVIGY